jgi:5-methylcytosine-specific restriction endonuclease McrA
MKICPTCKAEFELGDCIDGKCRPCMKAYQARYYAENRERIRAMQEQWRQKNPEYLARYGAEYRKTAKFSKGVGEWRKRNREKTLAYSRSWYSRNRDQHRAATYRWAKDNNLAVRAIAHTRRHRSAGAVGSFSSEDILAIYAAQEGKCAACAAGLERYHIDHVMPLALGGSNFPSNLQLLCPSCNCSKGSKHPSDWTGRAAAR